MEFLVSAGRLLPVTVVGAIILFILREVIEGTRRKRSNSRKRTAIRRLIADEIERNNWTIKSMRHMIETIELAIKNPETSLEIRSGVRGELYLRHNKDGEAYSQSPFGKVHNDALSANLLSLAEVDQPVFDKALEVSDALKELDHVLNSMVKHIGGDFEYAFLEGLVEFATDEIADCEKTLSDFYERITGQALKEHRLR